MRRASCFRSLVTIVVASALMGACSAQDGTPHTDQPTGVVAVQTESTVGATQPRPTPSVTRRSIPTTTYTPTVYVTPTPTFTGTPLPPRSEWKITDDFLFGPSLFPDCELPCWQGLTVGVSGREDIQLMFQTIFNFSESPEFLPYGFLGTTVPGLHAASCVWRLGQQLYGGFHITAWVDEVTYVLRSLEFEWSYAPFNSHMSPQAVIRELGTPSHVWVEAEPTSVSSWGDLRYLMIYEQGMIFEASFYVPMAVTLGNGIESAIIEFCLGGPSWTNVDGYTGHVVITEPVPRDLGDLSPLQKRSIQDQINLWHLTPIQELVGISIDELVQLALTDPNACIYIDVTDHFTN